MSKDQHKKEVFSFPCRISLKAIGKDDDNYRQFVIDTVLAFLPDLDTSQVISRPSRGDNFLSITIPIMAESRQQLDAIYEQLGKDARTRLIL